MKVRKLLALKTSLSMSFQPAWQGRLLAPALLVAALVAPATAVQARLIDAAVVHANAPVTAVDPATRSFTVTGENGEPVTLIAGPEIRNFDRIKVGDTLQLAYYESLDINTRPKGSGIPEVRTEVAATQAKRGQMPRGGQGVQTTVTAEIWHISPRTNTVILQGPSGGRQTVVVRDPQAIAKLATLKEGDLVDFTFTRAIAGAVVTPGKKAR